MDRIPRNQIRSINAIYQDEHEDAADARRVTLVDAFGEFINSSNRLPVDVIINSGAATTPKVVNVPVSNAWQEVSYNFANNTNKISMRVRDGYAKIQYAWEAGKSGTDFITVQMGNVETIEGVELQGKTLYFQLSKGSKVVEIVSYEQ